MAFWNALVKQENATLLACRAGIDIIDSAVSLRSQMKKDFGVDISFCIGIHCRKAVIGNIGTKSRMDYTAIGDTVNTASRLQSNAEGGEILVSRAALDELGELAKAEKVDRNINLNDKESRVEDFVLKSITERGQQEV